MIRKTILMFMMFVLILPVISFGGNKGRDEEKNKDDVLKCANLIYAGSKSSVCFSSKFL